MSQIIQGLGIHKYSLPSFNEHLNAVDCEHNNAIVTVDNVARVALQAELLKKHYDHCLSLLQSHELTKACGTNQIIEKEHKRRRVEGEVQRIGPAWKGTNWNLCLRRFGSSQRSNRD